jgi:hypothetical protein
MGRWLLFFIVPLLLASAAFAAGPLEVRLGPGATAPASGRLIVFATKVDAGPLPPEIVANPFRPASVVSAAAEVTFTRAGQARSIDLDGLSFPGPFSELPPGDYALQAVLDVDHLYAYQGRVPQDPASPVVRVRIAKGGALPVLTLAAGAARPDAFALADPLPPKLADALQAAGPDLDRLDFVSPALSRFWGRDIHMRGYVVRPPGYDPRGAGTYPTVYWTHGFGGRLRSLAGKAAQFSADMRSGRLPPMFVIVLDQSTVTGTHEFADSVNNGPWGAALTEELIPDLEARYRMIRSASKRFVTGHSSGGWAALWLQVRYPKVFGGAWATSPDPSDFHDFTGVDIYGKDANAYRKPDGTATPLVRDHAQMIATLESFMRQEEVLGTYGGQLTSFDWVFSPRGPDGRPQPLFNRANGAVDPAVAMYWRDHYDIAWRITHDGAALKPDLDGKVHLYVGTADTFYLDGAAHRLERVFEATGLRAEFRFIPDRTHFDLYRTADDPRGLERDIFWAMYGTGPPPAAGQPASRPGG